MKNEIKFLILVIMVMTAIILCMVCFAIIPKTDLEQEKSISPVINHSEIKPKDTL